MGVMLYIWWDCKCVVHDEVFQPNETVTGKQNATLGTDQFKLSEKQGK